MNRIIRIVLGVVVVLGLAGLGLIAWGNDAYPPLQPALNALQSDSQVTVTEQDGFITFEPVGAEAATGFILYPGGRVDYRVYAPVLRQIAERGFIVAVVQVPINLAFFDGNAADRVITKYPAIPIWAIGGHSLGGVAASSYVSNHLNQVAGLVLWASYPADDSLAGTSLKVLSVYGTNDMAGMEPFDKSRAQLPVDTQYVVIDGGNHAQFGSYGPQKGDNPAAISAEAQWTQITDATVRLLEALSQ